MFERFTRQARSVVKRSQVLAREDGATAVDASHLLMAVVVDPTSAVATSLNAIGIDEQSIRRARTFEFQRALASVGVATSSQAPVGSRRLRQPNPRFGQSAKLALERALGQALDAQDRRITDRHLVLAIVSADTGATPRLLAELGVTAEQIRRSVA